MRLYVIGPVTGRENLNRAAFEEAKEKLLDAGYDVLIPHDVVPPDYDYARAMRTSIVTMLGCDGVAFLPDWDESRGAKLEREVAIAGGLPIHCVDTWLLMADDCPENDNLPEETANPPSDGARTPLDEVLGAITRRMDETNAMLRAIYHQIGSGVALNAALLVDGNAEKAEEAKKTAFAISLQAESHYKSAVKENQDGRA